nr:lipid droplet assembly factor 1 isoform X5 [Rattus norvegicus]
MKSPVGRFLDRHPFLVLTVLMFVTMSAIPVGFFLLIVVLTSLGALMGAILLEGTHSTQGLVISVCGLSLLCILCGLGFVSLALSGITMMSYVVVSCLMSYWFSPSRPPTQQHANIDSQLAMKFTESEKLGL